MGDVITAVDSKDVKSPGDFARKIGAMAPGTEVKLSIQRKGEEKTSPDNVSDCMHQASG